MKAEIRRAFHMLMFTKKKGEHDIRVVKLPPSTL